ncbi:MAG: ATP-binding cassette domain-containing protein [Deltaproteobacteria bacterium]|nr:ATP-binding cassette domain-containing protein [Deltaproteobacteria bacterium]
MPLLEVKNLIKRFPAATSFLGKKKWVAAVNDVSFSMEEGETLGLVGESGSGKSTVAKMLMALLKPDSGTVRFEGENLHQLRGAGLKRARRNLQMIFQDPFSSLNPRQRVESLLQEGMKIHHLGSPDEREKRCLELLKTVGLSEEALGKYPHEFSGGQRQRLGIARALSVLPKLLVCDEPVSALDVSIQAQMINLLADLKAKYKLSYFFISHDLRVVQHLSDRIAVMYLGRLVEILPSSQLLNCKHPYTQSLMASLPSPLQGSVHLKALAGEPPSPLNPPSGCSFHPRCPFAEELCKQERPVLAELVPGHSVACHLVKKVHS